MRTHSQDARQLYIVYRYRIRTHRICSELQSPIPRHPTSPSGLSPTTPTTHVEGAPLRTVALLCSTSRAAAGLHHGLDYFMDSIDVAERCSLRQALRVVDEEG